MLGKNHILATTSTGLAGLYGLYHLNQNVDMDSWQGTFVQVFTDTIGVSNAMDRFSLITVLVICTLGLILGSLLPDIDSKNSILGRYVPFMEDIIGHRGITHTIWVISLLFLGAYFVSNLFVWMVAFGYFFHVLQDSFSRQGVAWIYPLGKGYRSYGNAKIKEGFHIPIYRVGSPTESLIVMLFMFLLAWALFKWSGVIYSLSIFG